MTNETQSIDHASERVLSRLIFFSDAVFAIVLTLLVLELRPPPAKTDAALLNGLWALSPHLLAFVSSFALVSAFWVAHMSIMRMLAAFDWRVAIVNLLFLFTITLMPFAAGVLGEHGLGVAWQIYCAVLIAASLTQTLLLVTIAQAPNHLTPRDFWRRFLRALSPAIAFAVGFALNVAGYRLYSFFCWTLIPVIFLIVRLALGPRRARA